jgi:nucleotide-binding universal stress UspA family protein
MSCIVCATRGGEGSRAAQLEAIRLSKEMGERLVFLYVIDPRSLGEFDDTLLDAVEEELDWMGQTLLGIAQRRAHMAGLEAGMAIRQGDVRAEISRFLEEAEAKRLLLGAPRGATANVFGDDAVEQFALAVEEKTNIPVQIVRPETVEGEKTAVMPGQY